MMSTATDGHKAFKDARAAEMARQREQRANESEMVADFLPKKDNSIKLNKVYEFQFFDDFESIQLMH